MQKMQKWIRCYFSIALTLNLPSRCQGCRCFCNGSPQICSAAGGLQVWVLDLDCVFWPHCLGWVQPGECGSSFLECDGGRGDQVQFPRVGTGRLFFKYIWWEASLVFHHHGLPEMQMCKVGGHMFLFSPIHLPHPVLPQCPGQDERVK